MVSLVACRVIPCGAPRQEHLLDRVQMPNPFPVRVEPDSVLLQAYPELNCHPLLHRVCNRHRLHTGPELRDQVLRKHHADPILIDGEPGKLRAQYREALPEIGLLQLELHPVVCLEQPLVRDLTKLFKDSELRGVAMPAHIETGIEGASGTFLKLGECRVDLRCWVSGSEDELVGEEGCPFVNIQELILLLKILQVS